MKHTYRTPYDVFESIHGAYNPEPFSNWMREEKAAYLDHYPEAAKNQIDGHFYDAELERFFRWISGRTRARTPRAEGTMKPRIVKSGCFWIVLRFGDTRYGWSYNRVHSTWAEALRDALPIARKS